MPKRRKRKGAWKNKHESTIIALAYLHRVFPVLAILIPTWVIKGLKGYAVFLVIGVLTCLFALWTFIGYKLRWKHIYCSYQNGYHQKMTPYSVQWGAVRKSDAYSIPLIFFVLGILMILVYVFRW